MKSKTVIVCVMALIYFTSCRVRLSDSTTSELALISEADNQDLVNALKLSIEGLVRLNEQFEPTKFLEGIGLTDEFFNITSLNDQVSPLNDQLKRNLDAIRMIKKTESFKISWRDKNNHSHNLSFEAVRPNNESFIINATKLVLRSGTPATITYKATEALQEFTEPLDKLIVRIDTSKPEHELTVYFQNAKVYTDNQWQKIIPKFNKNIRPYNIACPLAGGVEAFINEMWLIKDGDYRKIGFEVDQWTINNFDVIYQEKDFQNQDIKIRFGRWESFKLTPEIAKTLLNKYFREKTKGAGKFEIVGECSIKNDN